MARYPTNDQIYNQSGNDDMLTRMPATTLGRFLGDNVVSPLNPYVNTAGMLGASAFLLRPSAIAASGVYGLSLKEGMPIVGRGAPIGFKSLLGGSKFGFLAGAGMAASNAYANQLDLASGVFQTVAGGLIGNIIFGPKGGVAGAIDALFTGTSFGTKLREGALGKGGFLGGGFGNESVLRMSIGNRFTPAGTRIAQSAPYTGTTSSAFNTMMSGQVRIHNPSASAEKQIKNLTRQLRTTNKAMARLKASDTNIETTPRYKELIDQKTHLETSLTQNKAILANPLSLSEISKTMSGMNFKLTSPMRRDIFGDEYAKLFEARFSAYRRAGRFMSPTTARIRRVKNAYYKKYNSVEDTEIKRIAKRIAVGEMVTTKMMPARTAEAAVIKELVTRQAAANLIAQQAVKKSGLGSFFFTDRKMARLMYDLQGASGKSAEALASILRKGKLQGLGEKEALTAVQNAMKAFKGVTAAQVSGQVALTALMKITWWKTAIVGGFTVAGGLAKTGMNAMISATNALNRLGRTEFGSGRAFESAGANTERQRALVAISNSNINARSYLGREAELMHAM